MHRVRVIGSDGKTLYEAVFNSIDNYNGADNFVNGTRQDGKEVTIMGGRNLIVIEER